MYQFKLDFPVPKADEKRYNETLNLGFKNNQGRKENYNKYLTSSKSPIISYMPIKADIENVSRCNLSCSHCLVSTFENNKRAADLSLFDFKEFIDEQNGLVEIKIQGLGEPFLDKDFTKMVEYASSKNIWVRTTTNGTILHKNENYKRIIDANVGEIQVSIDGASKEVQESIRKGSKLDVIKKNCSMLNEYGQQQGVDFTRMWTVFQNKNLSESKDLLYMAKEIGFKRVTFSIELREWESGEELNEGIKEKRINEKINQQWINDHLVIANDLGINLTFWCATERFTKKNICMWPFERFLYSSDQYFVPCCIIADPKIFSFGNIGKENFQDLWFGEKLQRFREAHIKGEIPDVCKACYY
jgi:pyrroloquinoline quinone biosynthesis protein E